MNKTSYHVFAMSVPRVKYAEGKTVCRLDLWVGTALGVPRHKDNYNNVNVLSRKLVA